MKPTLYALMVAVDNYPIPRHRLNGCVNDRNEFKTYLEENVDSAGFNLNIKTLTDKEASRKGVVEGFAHFDAAKAGDCCLLYFSGHGSQVPAPKEFWDSEPDRKLESIVCWDSRLEGGMDLMDKELSYLIWKAKGDKDLSFAAVFDCCHSGSNTRNLSYKVRMAEANHTPAKVEDFLGFPHYRKVDLEGGVYYGPPRAKHIHLAASKSSETAKEVLIGGTARGVFTYNLVEVLKHSNAQLTYSELITRLNIKVGNLVRNQSPQLEAPAEYFNSVFLNGGIVPPPEYYLISFDHKKNYWKMNAGAVQGIRASDEDSKTVLEFEEGGTANVVQVFPNQSRVEGLDGKDRNVIHKAIIRQMAVPKLKVAFAPNCAASGKTELLKQLKENPSMSLEIVEATEQARYLIRIMENTFRLTLPEDERPVFQRIEGYTKAAAIDFINKMEHVAKWVNVSELSNPNTKIKDGEVEVKLYRVKDLSDLDNDNSAAEEVDWRKPTTFRYDYYPDAPGEKWKQPAFRLKITNKSDRALWASGVVLEDDFSITNQFLPKQELAAGEEVWMTDEGYKTLALSVQDKFYQTGITEFNDLLKLIVSTEELDTQNLNQEGLEPDIPATGKRSVGRRRSHISIPDWTTKDIGITVVRPLQSSPVSSTQKAALMGVEIEAPEGLSAEVSFATVEEAERSVSNLVPPDVLLGNQHLRGMAFTEGNNNSPALSVLELHKIKGKDEVNSEQPLKVKLPQTLAENEVVVPIGFDPGTGLYYPVGTSSETGDILIEQLPDETPSGTRSLGGSVKIFFQKAVLSKLFGGYQYPVLAMATVDEEDNLIYEKDVGIIKKAVAAADTVVLFIHGIIGDTLTMAKAIEHAKNENGEPIGKNYQVALTFDYENLSTSIKKTAKDLKAKLASLGLVPNHGKTFHIISHSMGGLVSRWLIEKEGGEKVVNHLIQLGTPNAGSPWANVQELAAVLLSRAINGASFLQPWLTTLSFAGKFLNKLFITLQEMHPKHSEILKDLNDGTDPNIPYSVIVGNTSLIPLEFDDRHQKLLQKVIARFKNRGHYDALNLLLFRTTNDIATAVNSAFGIAGKESWNYPPQEREIGCDHISYFVHPEGLKALAEVVFKINN